MSMSQEHPTLGSLSPEGQRAAEELLPTVYEELRHLAAQRLAHDPAGQSLRPTALVHEAYLRLAGDGDGNSQQWNDRAHFFGAAAEAMRRILVERARQKQRWKHGGDRRRVELEETEIGADASPERVLAIHEALDRLSEEDARAADVVKLRYFAGLGEAEVAELLGLSHRTVQRDWAYARAWLYEAPADS
jgi:RNA polymerase sigma factor (TIGR02999 family)